MASRGGRGGRGRGGASQKPQVNMGHLQFAEVMEMSKQGTDVLYPVSRRRISHTSAKVLIFQSSASLWIHLTLLTRTPMKSVSHIASMP